MNRDLQLSVEVFPDDGTCTQGCPHCPHAIKEKRTALFFPDACITSLAAVQEYVRINTSRIQRLVLYTGTGNPINISPFPLDPFPDEVAFALGKILPNEIGDSPHGKSEVLQSIVDATLAIVDACIGAAFPEDQHFPMIGFSIVPELDQDLKIENIVLLIYFFQLLILKVLQGRIKYKTFVAGFDNNAVDHERLLKLMKSIELKIQHDALIALIAREISAVLEEQVGVDEELSHSEINFRAC